jgi:hypothetical protein
VIREVTQGRVAADSVLARQVHSRTHLRVS